MRQQLKQQEQQQGMEALPLSLLLMVMLASAVAR
jgi:hypothetical protein